MAKPGVTRDKLIQVAFDLIWNSSYGAVSVGDICERAGVNKGSFYHFFESKTELVLEAYDQHWQEMRPKMDRLFSPQVPPLERIQGWCKAVYEEQRQKAEQYGHVCGCPFCSVGAEVATSDEKIRLKSEQLLQFGTKYFESAVADAIRTGVVTVTDPIQATQRACTIITGLMVQAKVQNNVEVLEDLEPAIMNMLGAKAVPA